MGHATDFDRVDEKTPKIKSHANAHNKVKPPNESVSDRRTNPDNGNFLFSGKGQETGSKHVDDDDECQVLLIDHESDDLSDLITSGHIKNINTLATTTIN